MRAFLVDSISGNAEDGFKFYNSALEVLKWGAERWKDVPDSFFFFFFWSKDLSYRRTEIQRTVLGVSS